MRAVRAVSNLKIGRVWEGLGVEARRRRASTPSQEHVCSFWRVRRSRTIV